MSWVTPRTWVTNDDLNETNLNTVRDNLIFLKSAVDDLEDIRFLGQATGGSISSNISTTPLVLASVSIEPFNNRPLLIEFGWVSNTSDMTQFRIMEVKLNSVIIYTFSFNSQNVDYRNAVTPATRPTVSLPTLFHIPATSGTQTLEITMRINVGTLSGSITGGFIRAWEI